MPFGLTVSSGVASSVLIDNSLFSSSFSLVAQASSFTLSNSIFTSASSVRISSSASSSAAVLANCSFSDIQGLSFSHMGSSLTVKGLLLSNVTLLSAISGNNLNSASLSNVVVTNATSSLSPLFFLRSTSVQVSSLSVRQSDSAGGLSLEAVSSVQITELILERNPRGQPSL
jgi:hypothetical protein